MEYNKYVLRYLLFFMLTFFCGCSSHQISFSVPPAQGVSKKLSFRIGIYIPDSLAHYTTQAILTGGLCEGHEFQLYIGNGILNATLEGAKSICDNVIMLSALPDASAMTSQGIKYIVIPEMKETFANANFSKTTFSVAIDAKIVEDINVRISDRSSIQILLKRIHCRGESSGKGEDCHDAAPYLKKAGEEAMQNLRDSIISRLSSEWLGK
jgi:hypothetical protein